MVIPQNFIHRQNRLKVLLKRFYLNGNNIGFHPQTQKLELYAKYIVPCKNIAGEVTFEWSTEGSYP